MVACGHRLEDTGETVEAGGLCCGQESQAVYRCAVKGKCIDRGVVPGIQSCNACTVQNRPPLFPTMQPTAYMEIKFLQRAADAGAFNCSLHGDERNGFAFAFRSGWTSSGIRLCRLTDGYRPTGVMSPAFLLHPRAPRGCEDPRLFRFRDKWHISFTGYEADVFFSSVLVASIGKWPTVERVWAPNYSGRNHAEKNWVFFDHGGELHAVYKSAPEHRVIKFAGDNVSQVYSSEWKPDWEWGEIRGGASPILHNGEWYSFFHGYKRQRGNITYTCGLYTFENSPPFRPLRMIPKPLVIGGFSHQEDAYGWRKQIYYPCGAALKNSKWHISAGEHDNKCSVVAFDAAEIEKALSPVKHGFFARSELSTILSLNGWCDETKAQQISKYVASIPEPVNGIEIGVFAGRSLFAAAIGARANPHGGRVVGIDSYDAEENLKGVDTPEHRSHWTRNVVEDARASMRATREKLGLAPYCSVIERTSKAAFPMVQDESLNYLHIDGNHSKDGATFDAEKYVPLVKIGGLVLVDDTDPKGKPEFLAGVLGAVAVVEECCDLVEDHETWRAYRKVR